MTTTTTALARLRAAGYEVHDLAAGTTRQITATHPDGRWAVATWVGPLFMAHTGTVGGDEVRHGTLASLVSKAAPAGTPEGTYSIRALAAGGYRVTADETGDVLGEVAAMADAVALIEGLPEVNGAI